jgi:hypothetical protein
MLLLLLVGGAVRAAAADPAADCEGLAAGEYATIPGAPAHVTASRAVAAADMLPAFCQVQGYVAPNTGIELRLPITGWNGKFFHAGCTGSCGFAIDSPWARECDYPLARGYACIISDMGHRSGASDGLWAWNNLEAKVDFGFRATHRATVAGKALTEAFYGRRPERSYFMGCSTGGRQGLVAAQRFPDDFDGVIAGAPVVSEAATAMNFIWNLQVSATADRKPLLGPAELERVHAAVLAAADRDDGVVDGVVGTLGACGSMSQVCSAGRSARATACRPSRSRSCGGSTPVRGTPAAGSCRTPVRRCPVPSSAGESSAPGLAAARPRSGRASTRRAT